MAGRYGRQSTLEDWKRICFDSSVEIDGIKGPCEAPDCVLQHSGCKISQLIKRGIITESQLNSGSTLIQHTCGFKDEPLFTNSEGMGDFIQDMRDKHGLKKPWIDRKT